MPSDELKDMVSDRSPLCGGPPPPSRIVSTSSISSGRRASDADAVNCIRHAMVHNQARGHLADIPVPKYLQKPALVAESQRKQAWRWFLKLVFLQNSMFGFFVSVSKADAPSVTYWGLRGRPLTWWSKMSITEVLSSMPVFFCYWYLEPGATVWTDLNTLLPSAWLTVMMMVATRAFETHPWMSRFNCCCSKPWGLITPLDVGATLLFALSFWYWYWYPIALAPIMHLTIVAWLLECVVNFAEALVILWVAPKRHTLSKRREEAEKYLYGATDSNFGDDHEDADDV